jgi:opacity protein-like surface antigen
MHSLLRAICVVSLITLPTAASAGYWSDFQDNYNPYISGGGGLNYEQPGKLRAANSFKRGVDYYPGWVGEMAVGIHLPYGFRTEIEGGYLHNVVEQVHGFSHSASGGTDQSWKSMWNVLYDLRNRTRFTPYVGGGLGAIGLDFDTHPVFGSRLSTHEETHFGMQAIGGIDYNITSRLSTYVDYEYMSPFNSNLSSRGNDRTLSGALIGTTYQNNILTVGLKYTFDSPAK